MAPHMTPNLMAPSFARDGQLTPQLAASSPQPYAPGNFPPNPYQSQDVNAHFGYGGPQAYGGGTGQAVYSPFNQARATLKMPTPAVQLLNTEDQHDERAMALAVHHERMQRGLIYPAHEQQGGYTPQQQRGITEHEHQMQYWHHLQQMQMQNQYPVMTGHYVLNSPEEQRQWMAMTSGYPVNTPRHGYAHPAGSFMDFNERQPSSHPAMAYGNASGVDPAAIRQQQVRMERSPSQSQHSEWARMPSDDGYANNLPTLLPKQPAPQQQQQHQFQYVAPYARQQHLAPNHQGGRAARDPHSEEHNTNHPPYSQNQHAQAAQQVISGSSAQMPPPARPGATDGHRHSTPSALLSYGVPPGPIQRPHTHDDNSAAHKPIAHSPHYQLPSATPTLTMYNFSTIWNEHFSGDARARASYQQLVFNYNNRLITPEDFYIGVYRVLYQTGSLELLKHFKDYIPSEWKGKDLTWYHRAIEKEHDDRKAVADAARAEADAAKVKGGGMIKRAEKVTSSSFDNHGEEAGGSKSKLLVKLPVNADKTPKKRTANTKKDDPEDQEWQPEQQSTAPPRKRRRPLNGFKPSEHREQEMTTPTTAQSPETQVAAQANNESSPLSSLPNSLGSAADQGIPQTGDSTQVTPLKQANRSPTSTMPLTAKKTQNLGHLSADEVVHYGPLYATRRAVLAREDRPYIHHACGMGFKHPEDVKGHHGTAQKYSGCSVIRAAIDEGGRQAMQKFGRWDDHESCQVGYRQINCSQVKGGHVILDKESWDKLEAACEAGREFKRRKEAGEESGATVESKADGDGEMEDGAGPVTETTVSEAMRDEQTIDVPEKAEESAAQNKADIEGRGELAMDAVKPSSTIQQDGLSMGLATTGLPLPQDGAAVGSSRSPETAAVVDPAVPSASTTAHKATTKTPTPGKRQYVKAGSDD